MACLSTPKLQNLAGELFGIQGICLLFTRCSWESSVSWEPNSESAGTHYSKLGMGL